MSMLIINAAVRVGAYKQALELLRHFRAGALTQKQAFAIRLSVDWDWANKIYVVQHGMPELLAANAQSICERVNTLTAQSGDFLYIERVIDTLDSICSRKGQAAYKIVIIETEFNADVE